MTYTPHSLLEAAKLVAEATGLEWSIVHRYYRDLQSDPNPWLPKSLGRNIWHAHPHYVARLLIALGMTDTPELAQFAMDTVAPMTPGGRKRHLDETDEPLPQQALVQFLIHEDQAADVDFVEFDYIAKTVIVRFRHGAVLSFSQVGNPAPDPALRHIIHRRGVIPGAVFVKLAKTIRWRRYCDAPLEGSATGVDAEA